MSDLRLQQPKDADGKIINRAMGAPIVADNINISQSAKYVDIFNLSSYAHRVFHGISVFNPSPTFYVQVAIGGEFDTTKNITVPPNCMLAFDNQSFGSALYDETLAKKCTRVRAKIDGNTGILSSATISYAATQPLDQDTVIINGTTYEFSSDKSAAPGNVKVDIGVSADATFTNLVSVVNANDQGVTLTIDTTADIVTVTSNYGGTYGDGTQVAAGVGMAGIVFSGNTTGGAGGVVPVFHIW